MKQDFEVMQTGTLVIAFRKGKLQMDVLILICCKFEISVAVA